MRHARSEVRGLHEGHALPIIDGPDRSFDRHAGPMKSRLSLLPYPARLALRITCATALAALSAGAAHAADYADGICKGQARSAQAIAQARDSGISKEDELQRIRLAAQQMPYDSRMLALTELPQLVEALYGEYANVPATQMYPKYLDWCRQQIAKQRAPAK